MLWADCAPAPRDFSSWRPGCRHSHVVDTVVLHPGPPMYGQHVYPRLLGMSAAGGPPVHPSPGNFLFFFLINLFYFWLHWVFIALRGLSLVTVSNYSWRCAGFSLWWLLLLQSTGSRHAGSVGVARGLRCSAACRIFPDQGSNSCPLHWQADSQPLRHHGSSGNFLLCRELSQAKVMPFLG